MLQNHETDYYRDIASLEYVRILLWKWLSVVETHMRNGAFVLNALSIAVFFKIEIMVPVVLLMEVMRSVPSKLRMFCNISTNCRSFLA